jgi:PAS domain S-box-containing protein
MSQPASLSVLVVDDDPDTRANLCDILELDGHAVETAGTVAEVLARRDWSHVAAVILDRRLPDGSAEELLPRLRRLAPDAMVLIVTGFADLQGAIAALRQGAADYILKPINADALRASLARVAERRRLTAAKERSEAAFRTLVEEAPCLIVILRPAGADGTWAVAYFNRWAEELTGLGPADVLGRDFLRTLVPEEARGAMTEQLTRVLAGTPVRNFQTPVAGRDGDPHWVIWNARRLADYDGAAAVLAVGQDITALRRAQERTLQAERLAAIGQMMTGLAHESGNALARSQACLEMLALEVQDRPDALDLVARTQKAQDHLRQLYDEVRGYAAPLKLEREPCPLPAVWRQAWSNLAVQRQGRLAALREETGGVDLCLGVDPFRIEQVFRNVFENALAACRDPVEITVGCADDRLEGQPALRVAVRDNGPGLGPEQRRRIFEPFYTTKTKGTGLGMAIAKRIVEAHGGRIDVGGAPGAGAEIVLLLPRELP